MEFKDRLKELRTQAGISQAELSTRLGMAKSTIGMYEIGQIDPSIVALKQMARFFHVDACYLLGEEKDVEYDYDTLELIDKYQQLNAEGKDMAAKYVDMLMMSGYKDGI